MYAFAGRRERLKLVEVSTQATISFSLRQTARAWSADNAEAHARAACAFSLPFHKKAMMFSS